MGRLHLHLISDSTGETLENIAKAAIAQFDDVEVVRDDEDGVPGVAELVEAAHQLLDVGEVDQHELKWIILMVLFNQPDQEAAYSWLENLMFDQDEMVN